MCEEEEDADSSSLFPYTSVSSYLLVLVLPLLLLLLMAASVVMMTDAFSTKGRMISYARRMMHSIFTPVTSVRPPLPPFPLPLPSGVQSNTTGANMGVSPGISADASKKEQREYTISATN